MTKASDETTGGASHPLAFAVRGILGVGALGLAIGSLTLIGEGLLRIVSGLIGHLRHTEAASMSSIVMKATDELLFGVVLMIFASNIVFGFCFDAAKMVRLSIPSFMRANTLHDLKTTFCQVIVVYLIVDFATDIVEGARRMEPGVVYFPIAILLIAGASWLLAGGHHKSDTDHS